MSKRVRANRTAQQIKEEQINFLLEDVEKNLEEYKKALDLKEYDKTVAENKELKIYIGNIKQRYAQYQQQRQAQFLEKQKQYYESKTPKKYKKLVYEEELDSEPKLEEEEYSADEAEEEPKIKKTKKNREKQKNNIFD